MGQAYHKLNAPNFGIQPNRCASNVNAYIVLAVYVTMVAFGIWNGLLTINLDSVQDKDKQTLLGLLGTYTSFLTPDSLTIRIGYCIEWVMLGGYIIAQILPSRISPSDFIVMEATKLNTIGSFISFTGSLFLFTLPEQILTALLLLFVHNYFLLRVYFEMDTQYVPKRHAGSWQLQVLVYAGFSVGVAWSVFISLVTFAACVKCSFALVFRADVTCSIIALIGVFACRIIFTKCDLPHTLISVWALWGIGRKNVQDSKNSVGDDSLESGVVGQTAYVCMLIIIAVYFSGVIYTLLVTNRGGLSIIYDNSVLPGSLLDSPYRGATGRARSPVQPEGESLTERLLVHHHTESVGAASVGGDDPEVDL